VTLASAVERVDGLKALDRVGNVGAQLGHHHSDAVPID